jgi:hypothetical protein
MTGFPDAAAWRKACTADAVLGTWAGPWAVCFAIRSGSDTAIFNFAEGQVAADPGTPAFILAATEATWARFLEQFPPRHHHGIFAMMYRLPEFSIQGDELAFMQHAHIARRVLEVGKWLAMGRALRCKASGTSRSRRTPNASPSTCCQSWLSLKADLLSAPSTTSPDANPSKRGLRCQTIPLR